MNVGEEEGKGHDLVQKTYDLFRASPLKDRFVGNIEGRDIHRGAATWSSPTGSSATSC